MPPELVFALVAAAFGGGGLARLFSVRALNRRTDAVTLTKAYGSVIDRLQEEVRLQGKDIVGLREHVTQLLTLISARDAEIAALRIELAALRASSALGRRATD